MSGLRKALARREVVQAAIRSVSSELHAELHPGSPNLDAESEYNDERLDEAARKLVAELDSEESFGVISAKGFEQARRDPKVIALLNNANRVLAERKEDGSNT